MLLLSVQDEKLECRFSGLGNGKCMSIGYHVVEAQMLLLSSSGTAVGTAKDRTELRVSS